MSSDGWGPEALRRQFQFCNIAIRKAHLYAFPMTKKNPRHTASKPRTRSTKGREEGEPSQINFDRREFLKTGAKAGLGLAGLSALGCTTTPKSGNSRGPASDISVSVGADDQYEFIVVGSGAGGGPVAANLARKGYKVLLLEAGGIRTGPIPTVPAFHCQSVEDSQMAWNFFVRHYADDTRASGDSKYVPGQGILYPRAATLGGCTVHNALITLYPDNKDFDDIAKLTGDASWNSRDMRAYFVRLERNNYATRDAANASRMGFDGWLDTSRPNVLKALKDPDLSRILAATLGVQNVAGDLFHRLILERDNYPPDPNRWEYVTNKANGIFSIPNSAANGLRSGPRDFILSTMQSTSNLVLKTNAFARRVLFSDQDASRAIGIEYLDGPHLYQADSRSAGESSGAPVRRAFATREVILAGGAFNTPQLLMLSGVGDAGELRSLGIPGPYIQVPGVGKNLQDRYEFGVVSQMSHDLSMTKNCSFGAPGDPCFADYEIDPSNSVYSYNGVIISLIRKSSSSKDSPDLCIFGLPGRFRGYFPGWSKEVYKHDQFTWAVLKGHTQNTSGRVRLKSTNPLQTPDISFNYFDQGNGDWNDDLTAVLAGVKIARQMNRTLTTMGVLQTELVPGPDAQSDEDLRKYIMRESWGHHASCSNKMGIDPDGPEQAVVDSRFRVHKTKGLRIVDASVFPKVPGLFIALPIYMIAEKASQVITEDNKKD